MRQWIGMIAALLLLAIIPRAHGHEPSNEPEEPRYDCGTKALYFLLRLEGISADLDSIAADLDRRSPVKANSGPDSEPRRDRSMLELREAAGRFGLKLDGIRIPGGKLAPSRPAIAYIDRKPHGHFVVVKPVGHTGSLVQVLDGESEPEVIDAARLYASESWTGLALVPRRQDRTFRWIGATASLAVVGFLTSRVLRRRGQREP